MAQPAPRVDVSPASPDPSRIDQRVRMHGVSWQAYEAMLAWRGERSTPRMTYLEGELELMSPSRLHEILKTRLARLLEAWSEEKGIPLDGVGSWTIRDASAERGAEADECYVLGDAANASRPDFAIEVVWTGGGIDKLDVWRKLGVSEVWIWEDGALTFHLLRGQRYVRAARSALLPTFDPLLVARFMTGSTQAEAVKALRAELKAPRPGPTRPVRARKRTR
jgi:Uma2 family endonuclease